MTSELRHHLTIFALDVGFLALSGRHSTIPSIVISPAPAHHHGVNSLKASLVTANTGSPALVTILDRPVVTCRSALHIYGIIGIFNIPKFDSQKIAGKSFTGSRI
jgi:hypothetical protein